MRMQASQRYRILYALKIVVFLFTCWYIWYHIAGRTSPFKDSARLLHALTQKQSGIFLFLVMVLMIVNWSLEALKWKLLLNHVEYISFGKSLRSVFGGVTFSFYTPNRIGEFAGRIIHLKSEHRLQGTLVTFAGNTSQAIVTVQAGLLALTFSHYFIAESNLKILAQVIAVLLAVSMPVAWFSFPRFITFAGDRFLSEKIRNYASVFTQYAKKDLIKIYSYSVSRYLVFCLQQFLLFRMFGMNESLFTVITLAAVSFFFISVIPSIALGELGLRGGINLAVFGKIFSDSAGILVVTFLLWLINIALPALLGAFAILYIRISKTDRS